MKKAHLFLGITLVVALAMLSSCSVPKDIAYFQDFNPGKSIVVQNPVEIKFKADDEIRIMVSSDKKELADLVQVLLLFQYYEIEKRPWKDAVLLAGFPPSKGKYAKNQLGRLKETLKKYNFGNRTY